MANTPTPAQQTPCEVQIADALTQADKALAVLFTMLQKAAPQGAMVADEVRGSVREAQKKFSTLMIRQQHSVIYIDALEREREKLRNSMETEHTQLVLANAALLTERRALVALVKRYASECGECGGKGWYYVGEGISGRGPDDVEPEQVHCAECADIRAALHQVPR